MSDTSDTEYFAQHSAIQNKTNVMTIETFIKLFVHMAREGAKYIKGKFAFRQF